MPARRGARSLKQATQDSLVRAIASKNVSADVLIEAPTHIAVKIMKHVTEELERTHKATTARSAGLLKQKQCQLTIAERQLAIISRIFEKVWRLLSGSEGSLDVIASGCHYRIECDQLEPKMRAARMIWVETTGPLKSSFFRNESIKSWGFENWSLSTSPPRPIRYPDTFADFMVGETLMDGRTGQRVTDPFIEQN